MAKVKEMQGKCWVIRHVPSWWYLADDGTLQQDLEQAMAFTDVNEADRRRGMIEELFRNDYQVMSCEKAADEPAGTNEARHTPGPWRTAIRRGYVAVMAGPQLETKAVADCKTVDTEHVEQLANCTLIAAAPDLLHALQLMISAFGPTHPEMTVQGRAAEVALAAIRKATGEK